MATEVAVSAAAPAGDDEAYAALRGFEELACWMLTELSGEDLTAEDDVPWVTDDGFGEYDTFPCGPVFDLPELVPAEGAPGFFTNLMLGGELPPPPDAAAAEADPAPPLPRTSSSASSATQADGSPHARGSKRGRQASQSAEADTDEARPSRRPRRRYREGEPRAPRGRPRVDPAKAYFRHLRSYSSSESGILGESAAAQAPAEQPAAEA